VKNLSASLNTHLNGEVTSLTSCWQISRRDGVVIYLTDHDVDLVVAGQLYRASDGYNRSPLKGSSGTSTDEMDLTGYLNSSWLKEDDLIAGLFDFAEIKLSLVNWQDPSMGVIPLRKGWIGEVSWRDGQFKAELRGLSNALKRNLGQLFTPDCSADLGDNRCKVDLIALGFSDIVASVSDPQIFKLINFAGLSGDLSGGIAHFTSGANAGQKIEISSWVFSDLEITLYLPCPYPLLAGDLVTVYPGCDKRFATCRNRYSNQINFRGFPHVPGIGSLLEVADD